MDRSIIALLALAAGADGQPRQFSPVQAQKALFLSSKLAPELFGTQKYRFSPYDYGPFDKAVYEDYEWLSMKSLVVIDSQGGSRYRLYKLTEAGRKVAEAEFAKLSKKNKEKLSKISDFVRSLSFDELVSAIYKAFPEMQVNSVFKAG